MMQFGYAARLFGLLLLVLGSRSLLAQEKFDYWRQANPDSRISIDQKVWDGLLSRYLSVGQDGISLFAYKSVNREDDARLSDYIATLTKVTVTDLAREEQMALWINLYNALTVRVILDYYPVDSIREIRFGLLDRGPWSKKLVMIEGMELSLDDIEHRILRPIFGDNRIHYALNCAAIGCPNLQPHAYTRGNLNEFLDAGARDYINNFRGVEFSGNELIVSSLFKWYSEDFGSSPQLVIEHLKQYAQPSLRRRLDQVSEISDYVYDWSLNDG